MVLPTYQKTSNHISILSIIGVYRKYFSVFVPSIPELVMQLCAGGGARVNYGLLPYFDEFWTSDDTDALQRIYMQWGVSGFFPAIAMASQCVDKNHQTGRRIPLKFRFDVAMSGRLGMEIQPKDMNDVDKAFAKRAIAAYKDIRPVVQFGDLYRLVSPYDNKGVSSLMYVTSEKNKAVFYAYKISFQQYGYSEGLYEWIGSVEELSFGRFDTCGQ